jgi:hypothetical protein
MACDEQLRKIFQRGLAILLDEHGSVGVQGEQATGARPAALRLISSQAIDVPASERPRPSLRLIDRSHP